MELALGRASTPLGIRFAGGLYLIVIAGGLFAEAVVRQGLLVVGDAAATAEAIAANEPLWRTGIAVHVLYLPAAIVVNTILYRAFRPVHPTVALLALVFSLVALAVEAVSLLLLYVPLAIRTGADALAGMGFPTQDALSYLAIDLFSTGFGIALTFFAFFCLIIGGLILGSRLLPAPIGALMMLAGACYLTSSVAAIVAPAHSEQLVPWILLPAFVGELTFATWLVVRGLNVSAVEQQISAKAPTAAG